MPFAIKQGKSVDNDTQARVLKHLFKGEYNDAYSIFNNITPSDLREVSNEYEEMLKKYSNYYSKHKKAEKVIKQLISHANSAAEGKTFKMPKKKYNISFVFDEDNVEDNTEAEVEIPATVKNETSGFSQEPVPVIKPEPKPRIEEDTSAQDEVKVEADEKVKVDKAEEFAQIPQKIGLLGPHDKNITEADVIAAIGESPSDMMRDFSNWFIFDLPTDSTGVGSAKINPLVKQNELLERFNGEGDLFRVDLETYTLTEGPEEIKTFYNQHPDLLRKAFEAEMKKRSMLKNEAEFLAQFDSKSNGLFSQDQTMEERNNFRNIYQVPSGSFGQPDEYPMMEPVAPSMFVDSEITQNKTLFPDSDVSYF